MHVRWGALFSSLVESIPLIATVVTSILSILMARATLRYAVSADKSLALAREEFEREWAPELHIKLSKVSPTDAELIVTNLAKISVLIQMVQLRRLSHATPFERVFLNEPLVGGRTWTQNFQRRLITATGDEFEGPNRSLRHIFCFRAYVPHRLVPFSDQSEEWKDCLPRANHHGRASGTNSRRRKLRASD
jgi:hypothetical protein